MKLGERREIEEAVSAGLKGMDHLFQLISLSSSSSNDTNNVNNLLNNNQIDCSEITDFTISKFKQVIHLLDDHHQIKKPPTSSSSSPVGHARFRDSRYAHARFRPPPPPSQPLPQPHDAEGFNVIESSKTNKITLNNINNPIVVSSGAITKPRTELTLLQLLPEAKSKGIVTTSPAPAPPSIIMPSLISPVVISSGGGGRGRGDYERTIRNAAANNKGVTFAPAATIAAAAAAAAPPPSLTEARRRQLLLSQRRRCVKDSAGHCSCTKPKKSAEERAIRVKVYDMPKEEFTWRKYGQKVIKGGNYPRNYYKCSVVKGCPARKHVKREEDDPSMVVISYMGQHCHTKNSPKQVDMNQERMD